MLSLNYTLLQAVADQALLDAAAHPRWVAAIGRALVDLDANPWIERNPNGHGLIIGSTSGNCYAANGTCNCTAYQHGLPCYHRAMARLVRLHDEKLAAVGDAAQEAKLARKLAAARCAAQFNAELFA